MTSRRATKRGRPSDLRAALARRTQRVETYPLPIVDFDEVQAAQERHQRAHEQLDYAKLGAAAAGGPITDGDLQSMIDRIEKEHDEAKKALDACFWPIKVRGLNEADFDALVNAHPPTAEQAEDEPQLQWNRDTFPPALAAACVIDNELSAEEWTEQLAEWPRGDKLAFVEVLYRANRRAFTDAIPKD